MKRSYMKRRLFWKLGLIIATAVVALFYIISLLTSQTEDGMSYIAEQDKNTLIQWGKEAEALYLSGDRTALSEWLQALKAQENTWMTIGTYDLKSVGGDDLLEFYYEGNVLGRSVDWKIHLYFDHNPVMEIPFIGHQAGFLIKLPDRMRPGTYWRYAELTMQIILPAILLVFLSYLLYLYIMKPLGQLQTATQNFSRGNFDIRAKKLMGKRNDEFSSLATTFDNMAQRIGEQIISQRQLIADLSHELRTPLTRLDIALETVPELPELSSNINRIARESKNIRKLVEDTLTLAWLENEQPELQQESVELADLLDVLVEDAKFEFPDRHIETDFPNSAMIENSSHRATGQAIENILRNALRYTPVGKTVNLSLESFSEHYKIAINDQGPGVPEEYITAIFKPFFRVDKSRGAGSNSFGLGLALAKRQLAAVRGKVFASNNRDGGLSMVINLPKT